MAVRELVCRTLRPPRRARALALTALLLTGFGVAAGCAEAPTTQVVHVQDAAPDPTSEPTSGPAPEVTPEPEPAAAITFQISAPHAATIDPGPLLPLPVQPPAPPAPPPAPAAPVSEPDAPTTP